MSILKILTILLVRPVELTANLVPSLENLQKEPNSSFVLFPINVVYVDHTLLLLS